MLHNQSEMKNFRKTLKILSPNLDEHQLRRSMMQNGSYISIGVIEGRSRAPLTVIADFLIYLFSEKKYQISTIKGQPRWLSWMRRLTEDQEVVGLTPAEVGNILSWRLIMKYFLRSFPPFHWFKKGSCQFLAKECAQYWLTA